MTAGLHLDMLDRTDGSVAATAPDQRNRAPQRNRIRFRAGAVQAGVLVASLVGAAILFWGMPTRDEELPDAGQMALLGDDRNTSAENVEFWTRRVADVPASSGFRIQLASAQVMLAGDTGDLAGYSVAERTASTAVELAPGDARALLVLAATRSGQHDFRGALALAEQVLADDPTSVSALLVAGDAELELGDYSDARQRYDQAAVEVGGVAAIVSRFARLESQTGSIVESKALARKALVAAGDIDLRHADAAFYWFQLATYEFHVGAVDEAVELARTALTIDPNHRASTELLAQALVATGAYDDATVLYERMVEGGRGGADLHGDLAKLYERAGRDADAAEHVDLGLAVAQRDADRFPAERRHIIGFLADHDPTEALRLATLDLAERHDIQSHAWYAWSLFRTGDLEAAAVAIRPALAYGTEDAWLLYQAGSIEAAVGDTESARIHLAQALDLNPHFDLVHASVAESLLSEL